MDEERAFAALLRFHDDVSQAAAALHARHASRTKCARGCSACCVDGLTVFAVEAERIRRQAGELLARGAPHAPGACAFLDGEGACRVYGERPYVCRTQGLPLRWLDAGDAGQPVELRDACTLNFDDDGPPIEELPEEQCWTLGPPEQRLAAIQRAFGGEKLKRVPLRDLFDPTRA